MLPPKHYFLARKKRIFKTYKGKIFPQLLLCLLILKLFGKHESFSFMITVLAAAGKTVPRQKESGPDKNQQRRESHPVHKYSRISVSSSLSRASIVFSSF